MDGNLFLNLDDDLEERVRREAAIMGRTLEEEIRKRLIEGMGGHYEPLTADDNVNDDRVNIMLDLRTKRCLQAE